MGSAQYLRMVDSPAWPYCSLLFMGYACRSSPQDQRSHCLIAVGSSSVILASVVIEASDQVNACMLGPSCLKAANHADLSGIKNHFTRVPWSTRLLARVAIVCVSMPTTAICFTQIDITRYTVKSEEAKPQWIPDRPTR